MPVYNAGGYLRPAIQSVLEQSYRNLELLVVDDGSTDGCLQTATDLLADPRVRVMRQINSGKPRAMNLAISEARGEFYALNDADDLSAPTRIERQVRCMEENPDVAAVFSGHELVVDGRRMAPQTRSKSREDCRRDIQNFRMPAHDPTAMYRMSMVREMQYTPELLLGEGFDYMLRVGEKYPMMVLGECLYSYRIHSQSITKRNPATREQLVQQVLRRACERRGTNFADRFPAAVDGGSATAFKDNNLAAQFIDSALDQRCAGKRWGAIRTGLECSRLHLLDLHYQKAIVYATAPMWLVKRLRRNSV